MFERFLRTITPVIRLLFLFAAVSVSAQTLQTPALSSSSETAVLQTETPAAVQSERQMQTGPAVSESVRRVHYTLISVD
jgi:hypothetical protein